MGRVVLTAAGCPRPAGCTAEIPCPIGTYGDTEGQTDLETGCKLCEANSFTYITSSTKCLPCGPSAWSAQGESTCHCNGTHRAFQESDKSCICEPGYYFIDEGRRVSEEDSTQDCLPGQGSSRRVGQQLARSPVYVDIVAQSQKPLWQSVSATF